MSEMHEVNAARAPSRLRFVDVFLVVVITAAIVFLANLALQGFPLTPTFVLLTLLLQTAVMIGVVYAQIVHLRGVGWREIGLRACPRSWWLKAVAIGFVTVPVVGGINLAIQLQLGPFPNPQVDLLAPATFSWSSLAGTLLVAACAVPFAEEIIFRGLFYGWLRKHLGKSFSIAISAVIFALAHGILFLTPALAVQGAILAIVYERSASLWPPIIVHGTFNAIMVSAIYFSIAAGVSLQ